MTADGRQGRVTDGTARERRLPYGLSSGYIRPQERSLADKLTLAAAIAGLVNFSGRQDTWEKLFAQEPAVTMAGLLATRTDARRVRFAGLIETDPPAAAAELRDFARRVGLWLDRAAGRAAFSAQLRAIDGRSALTALVRTLSQPGDLAAAVLSLAGDPPADPIARARHARQALIDAHEQLLNVVATLGPAVERRFAARLGSGEIDPALGLLLTELELLEDVEARINRFPDRHVAWYFTDILGQTPLPAQRERVLLRFTPGQQPVPLEAGAALLARSAGAGEPQRYRLVEGLRVAPVRVADVRTLRFSRDPMISPQSEMGFVSGVSLATLRTDGSGERQRLFAATGQGDVAMGIAVASPMLALAEGRRRIDVTLGLGRRQEADPDESAPPAAAARAGGAALAEAVAAVVLSDPGIVEPFGLGPPGTAIEAVAGWVEDLAAEAGLAPAPAMVRHACLRHATTPEQVQAVYGRIVAATLVEGRPWPGGAYRDTLLARIAAHLGGDDAAAVAAGLLDHRREEVFQALLHDAFALTLSSEAGPLPVGVVRIAPRPAEAGPGITFTLQLDEAAPAIVPPAGAPAPELTIRMASHARFCPLSLFEPYALEAVEIAVRVEGMIRLAGFSDDGPLDTGQPFMPFGARPKDGAVFLVGAPELAAKPVHRVGLTLAWADLPRSATGFEGHYRDYGEDFRPPDPRLAPAYLTGEGWKPLAEDPPAMVRRAAPGGPLLPHWRFEAEVPGRPVPPGAAAAQADFRQRNGIRAGLFGLTLDCPGEAFGHAAYPGALAQAMRPSRLPAQRSRPMPPAPWTPQVSAAALDYSARATMTLDAPQAARPGERILQIGPFGSQEIFPARTRPGAGLFPSRLADGTLFVRIEGPGATGPVALLFEMETGSHQRTAFHPEGVTWHYLTATGWQRLPSWSLGSDSTDGLMRSGVVAIDVPDEDVVVDATEMPGTGVWLAASAGRHLHAFPRLASLSTNGASAERLDPGDAVASLPRTWSLDPPRPGLGVIAQVGPPLGGAPAETATEFRARVCERLRHRQRAVTAWDVERLVLSAFPEVWKAKCFSALDLDGRAPAPGVLTVAVVPAAPADARDVPGQAAMFDVLTLRRIEAFLDGRSSAFARVHVRNPSFERLQLRARVGFESLGDDGTLLRRLKLDVSRFLGVWTAAPPMDGFGWSLNLNDVAAYVAGLDYVRFMTDLSVLHLVSDDGGSYRLFDTARAAGDGGGSDELLACRERWSLALPMADHWIAAEGEPTTEAPRAAGIGELGIGETLVVDGMERA